MSCTRLWLMMIWIRSKISPIIHPFPRLILKFFMYIPKLVYLLKPAIVFQNQYPFIAIGQTIFQYFIMAMIKRCSWIIHFDGIEPHIHQPNLLCIALKKLPAVLPFWLAKYYDYIVEVLEHIKRGVLKGTPPKHKTKTSKNYVPVVP